MIIAAMSSSRLAPRLPVALATTVLWALAAGSAAGWALQWGGAQRPVDVPVAGTAPATAPVLDVAAVARALGAQPSAAAPADPDLAGRLALRGVLTHGAGGAALIALDGQPAKPLRVGAVLDGLEGGWTLRSVTPSAAVLAAKGRELRLELPLPDERPRSTAAPMPRPAATPVPRPVVAPSVATPYPGMGVNLPQR